jgi:5-methylcytosine-specific restriction protein A
MNMAMVKTCGKAGCKALIPLTDAYCAVHANEQRSEYDRLYRNRNAAAFYKSSPWTHMQKYIIRLYHGIDVYAYYNDGAIQQANTVHHIAELGEAWDRRLDESNLIPVSSNSHGRIEAQYKHNKAATQRELRNMLMRFRKEHGIRELPV